MPRAGRSRPIEAQQPAVSTPPFESRTPQAVEVERYLLGPALYGRGQWRRLYDAGLRPNDLWNHDHRVILRAAYTALLDEGLDLDAGAIRARVNGELDDPRVVFSLTEGSVTNQTDDILAAHVAQVREIATARKLMALMQREHSRLADDPALLQAGWARLFVDELHDQVARLPGRRFVRAETVADVLAAVESHERQAVLGDWLARGEITLLHGQPRDGKSWVALDFAVALTTGTTALGYFECHQQLPVLVVGNEDSPAVVATRIRRLAEGRGLTTLPDELFLFIHKGATLDHPEGQQTLLTEIQATGAGLVILDPLRSLTDNADKGPGDLRPVAEFLRRLVTETNVALLVVHHDTKPRSGEPDTRRKAQRASGGGLFSISDNPVSAERINATRTLLTPDGFKHIPDPTALIITRTVETPSIRLTAEASAASSGEDLVLQSKILDYLQQTGGGSGRAIQKVVGGRYEDLARQLDLLEAAGKVTWAEGKRRAKLWCLT